MGGLQPPPQSHVEGVRISKEVGHYAGENPATGVDLPEKVSVHEKHALTVEQIQRLLAVLEEPVRMMVQTGVLSGLRVGEILGLRWQDVDLSNRSMRIQQAAYRGSLGSPKTKGSKRTLPLPEALAVALGRHRKGSTEHGRLVFPTSAGTPYSDTNLLARHLKPAGKQIGAPWIGWHTLRRTHATLLSQSGTSPKDAQAQLGHAHIWTTMDIYTQPTPTHQREAVEKMSQLVTNGDELTIWPKMTKPQTARIQLI